MLGCIDIIPYTWEKFGEISRLPERTRSVKAFKSKPYQFCLYAFRTNISQELSGEDYVGFEFEFGFCRLDI